MVQRGGEKEKSEAKPYASALTHHPNPPPHQLDQKAFAKLVAFGSTRRKNSSAKDDPQLRQIVDSGVKNACIVAKGSPKHVEKILGTTGEENLEMLRDSITFLKGEGLNVFVDLEHFYDGFAESKSYATRLIDTCVGENGRRYLLTAATHIVF